jgi:Homeodomain-like domain
MPSVRSPRQAVGQGSTSTLEIGPARVRRITMKLKNKWREQAAQLLAEARFSHKKISELCGVSLASITKWKRRAEMAERIAELTAIYAEKALKEGLALRENRLAVLGELHEKLLTIVAERAADPMLAAVPGGRTGLVVRATKVVGKQVYESFHTDTKLVKELRGVEEQIARELGQWQERIEVEDVSLADIMAKARQRKPQAAQEPTVVEVEQEICPGDLLN